MMALRPAAVVIALFAASVSAQHHGMDPFAGSKCTCATFCDGSCDIEDVGKQTMELFRMTQFGVVDMTNKNTGDVPGDTSFVISRRTQAYECRQNPSSYRCGSGMAQFQGDVPNCTDLVLKVSVEFDGKFGPYQYCNPLNSSDPTSVAGGINVGWDCLNYLSFHGGGGGHPPPNFPLQCSAGYSGYEGYCFSGGSTKPAKASSLADCCETATKSSAHSWTYVNGTCQTFQYGAHAAHCAGGISGSHKYHPRPGPPPPPPCSCKRMNQTMGLRNMSGYSSYGGSHFGIWYSNPAMGECTGAQQVGDGSGCTWKLQSIDKAINASCLYEHIDKNIEIFDDTAKSCFAACPACTPPACTDAKMTDCYLKCYSDTSRRMTPAQLSAPWNKAFQGEDVADGGCPVVHQICPSGSTRPGCPPAGLLG